MKNEISINDITVGKIYQYEEKYHLAAIVEILDRDLSGEYLNFKAKIVEPIFGNIPKNEVFTFGRNVSEKGSEFAKTYAVWKVKKPGSITDYMVNKSNFREFNKYLESLKERFGSE